MAMIEPTGLSDMAKGSQHPDTPPSPEPVIPIFSELVVPDILLNRWFRMQEGIGSAGQAVDGISC